MGFRFRKSKQILPGVKLNFSSKSVGVSLGGKHARVSLNSSGRKTYSASIPGTGISYVKTSKGKQTSSRGQSSSNYSAPQTSGSGGKKGPSNGWTIFWLIVFFPVGLVMMWMGNWNKKVKIGISAFFGVMFLIGLAVPTDAPEIDPVAQTTETETFSENDSETITEIESEIDTALESFSTEETEFSVVPETDSETMIASESEPEITSETSSVPPSSESTPAESVQTAEAPAFVVETSPAVSESIAVPAPSPTQSATVYWTPNGKSYHSSSGCSTLSRSKTVLSGTLDEAIAEGKTDPCNVCH